MTDYLDEDPILPMGQKYALLSIVQSTNRDKFAVKIRGGFEDKESAQTYITKLNTKIDKSLQTPVFLVDMGKWLALPPPSAEDLEEGGGEQVYQEEFLQTMMKDYRNNQTKVDSFFTQRKDIIKEMGLEKDPERFKSNTEPIPEIEEHFPTPSTSE